MRRALTSVFGSAILILWGTVSHHALAQQAVPRDAARHEAAGTATLSGRVVRGDDETVGVTRAVVTLFGVATIGEGASGQRAVGVTISDGTGAFVFDGLPAGLYRVRATKPAFLAGEHGATAAAGRGTAIDVRNGQAVDGVLIRLARGAVVTGTITDVSGGPAAGAWVAAVKTSSPTSFLNQARTDERGAYRLFGLAPGEYFVAVTPPILLIPGDTRTLSDADVDAALDALARRAASRAAGGSGTATGSPAAADIAGTPRSSDASGPRGLVQGRSPATVYYPGTTALADATKVGLRVGEERTGVDFQLVLRGAHRVLGVVSGPDGRPGAGAQVSVETALGGTRIAGAFTDRTGAFSIANVPPGRYIVTARVSPLTTAVTSGRPPSAALSALGASSSRRSLWASSELDVGDADVDGVSLVLQPSLVVSGRVVFQGRGKPPSPAVAIVRVSFVGSASARFSASTGTDGAFAIGGVIPGPFRLEASVNGPLGGVWRLRSAGFDGRDLLDFPPDLSAATTDIDGIVLTFSDVQTEISGTIAGPERRLAIFPASAELWVAGSRRFVMQDVDPSGAFVVRGLPPGDYCMTPIPEREVGSWTRRETLERLARSAIRFTLAEGETKRLQ